jgi:hypothetical protein
MTRRRSRRRQSDLFTLALGAAGAVVVLVVVLAVLHVIGALVILAAVGGGGYALGRRHQPVAARPLPASVPSVPGPVAAELAGLRAERDRLAAELRDERTARMAAWDAAASVPPRPPRGDPAPLASQLLADPLSGVRRLGPDTPGMGYVSRGRV